MRTALSLILILTIFRSAQADAPRVVTDIAPIHGLVSRVMAGVSEPEVILPPGASPHGYAMRPSEARSLSQADLVFWVGPALTPWLSEPIETLAPDAGHITLMEVDGVTLLPFREGALFDGHAEHAHDEQDTPDGHDEQDTHEEHDAHEEHEAHGAATGQIDPHVWLDPHNASLFLDVVARSLSEADPDNAAQYRANARAGQQEITDLETGIAAQLAAVKTRRFLVMHDAYHYFEAHFGLEAVAAITLADGGGASAARLSEVRDRIASLGVVCVLTEPLAQQGLVKAVTGQQPVTVTDVDPIGNNIVLGTKFYENLLRQMAASFHTCLADQ